MIEDGKSLDLPMTDDGKTPRARDAPYGLQRVATNMSSEETDEEIDIVDIALHSLLLYSYFPKNIPKASTPIKSLPVTDLDSQVGYVLPK